MNCASCGRVNRPTARFCNGCGQALTPRCARCGSENAAEAQFCDACGSALLAAPAGEASARKIVTIVFADLIGSVALHERLDAENARRFIARYHEAMSAAVEAHGGTVVQLLGDGVLTAFGVPRVSEDDAIRGVRGAVAMQSAFRELLREQAAAVGAVGLRVAVNTGEVVVSSDQTSVIGDPTNVASRLQQEARDGDVLIGEATQMLVAGQVTLAPLGSFAIRGRVEPVSAYRVVSLDPPAGAQGTAFVGREEELRRLRASYDAAVAAPSARLAVLLGSPGLGKSRLLAEFTRRLRDRATVLTARCDLARGHSFAPLASALRALLELEDSSAPDRLRAAIDRVTSGSGSDAERARIATGIAALLAAAPLSSEEAFFVVRRLLAALAATRPVVLAIDDVQWAEPLLLDLAEHLVQWSAGVPLLVLLGARPELHETRAALTTPGGAASEVVTLVGLDASSAARLAANAVGADELPAALVGRVLAVSEGNPLFVGELVRMLVHDGALKREGDRWTTGVELARLEIPPTIHALLAARIERLAPEDRAILERAAVVGRRFSRAAVAHLLQRDPSELEARLESLRRSEWVEPDAGYFLGEPALRFHHALIRDAAYRRLLRRTRAELHERLADWIAARVGDAPEHDELLGRHLEQAHAHLKGLGPLDAHGGSLGARAARHLGNAGRLALARDDLRPASDLLGRAVACLESDDPARADLALDWCEALLSAGEVGSAARALAELGRFTDDSARLRAWHACFAGELAALTDPQALHATAEAVSAAAAALAAAGDLAGEAKAHSVHATALARLGQIGESEAALDRALAVARRAGDRRRVNSVLAGAPVAALFGPSPVARASGRCLDVVRVLRITQGAPAVEAVALRCQAVLEALRGRTEAARRMIASARSTVEELGVTQQLLEVEFFAGYIELLEGDREAAARSLSMAYEGLRKRGLGIDAARAAALLARTRLAQGDAVGAEVLSLESEALAGDDLNASIAWRGVRAEALARRGEHAAAVELARAAVELAAPTDALLHHATARVALAAALRAAGRNAEAEAEQARAMELWEAKGATRLIERARDRAAAPARALEAPAPAVTRRVRPNHATGAAERMVAAMVVRDISAVEALIADDFVGFHRPTGHVGDRRGPLAELRQHMQARDLVMEMEPLAALGDGLGLFRRVRRFSELDDVGPTVGDDLIMIEADANMLTYRAEIFAEDRLAEAVARLYERRAELLPEGAERARAAATARSVAAMLGPADVERWAEAFAPGVEFADMRAVGPGVVRGADAVLTSIRALFALSDDFTVRIDDVLASRDDALVVAWTNRGVQRDGGGAFERDLCQLFVLGPDGRLAQFRQFEAGREVEALACFDELSAPAAPALDALASPEAPAANAAARTLKEFERSWNARDWEGVLATYAPGHGMDDRRTLFRMQVGGEDFLANERMLFEFPQSRWQSELVATRGERLALLRVRFTAEVESSGPMAIEMLDLVEVDAAGRRIGLVVFDPDDDAAALAELEERHASQSPAPVLNAALRASARIVELLTTKDWPAFRALAADDFRFEDRRRHSLVSGDVEVYIRNLEVVSAWPGRKVRRTVLATPRDEVSLERIHYTGGADGTEFEGEFVRLCEVDAQGRLRAIIHFDPDDAPELSVTENAATRTNDRVMVAFAARDWAELERLISPALVFEDRRRLVQIRGDRALYLSNLRVLAERASTRRILLATAGERVALYRTLHTSPDAREDFEVETLTLLQVDAESRLDAILVFDPDADREARAELAARAAELERAAEPLNAALRAARRVTEASGRQDWAAVRALAASDMVYEDRRKRALLSGGIELYIRNLEVVSSWPGWQVRRTALATPRDELSLESVAFAGGPEGGEFVREFLILCEVDGEGRIRAVLNFDADDRDSAERELSERAPLDPLKIPANAASRAIDRLVALVSAGDWEGLRALCAPVAMEDRRPLVQLSGGSETLISTLRVIAGRASLTRQLVATAGDRLALERLRFVGPSLAFEIENLQLFEVDADGRICTALTFDLTQRAAAYDELSVRLARGEAANCWPPEILELIRCLRDRDLGRLAKVLPEHVVFHDHRRTGIGRIEGAAVYIASVAALFEQIQHFESETLYWVGIEPHASLAVARTAGTLAVSGGEFESIFLRLVHHDAGGIQAIELFELDDLPRARARFAKLRPNLLQVPPNAASRFATGTMPPIVGAGDWEALRGLMSPDFTFDDRRKRSLVLGDSEVFLKNQQWVHSLGDLSTQRELLASAGDRLVLLRFSFSGGADGGAFEGTFLRISELDAEGRLRAIVHFDPDDRRGASLELLERFVRSGAPPPAARSLAMFRRLYARDVEGMRSALPRGFFFRDHRLIGPGQVEGDAYVSWQAGLMELASDAVVEPLHFLAVEPHGCLAVAHTFGTQVQGGAFENAFLLLWGPVGVELFELADVARARARFAELRPS